jgi:hypothetical protein
MVVVKRPLHKHRWNSGNPVTQERIGPIYQKIWFCGLDFFVERKNIKKEAATKKLMKLEESRQKQFYHDEIKTPEKTG